MAKLTDDTKLFRMVITRANYEDLVKLSEWATRWQMNSLLVSVKWGIPEQKVLNLSIR